VILMSACQDNQVAMDGIRNGLFTEALLRVWDKGRFEGGYHHFCAQIAGFMPPTQRPKYIVVGHKERAFEHQGPFSIICAAGRRRRRREHKWGTLARRLPIFLSWAIETLRQSTAEVMHVSDSMPVTQEAAGSSSVAHAISSESCPNGLLLAEDKKPGTRLSICRFLVA
jgi:hypothetical protein